MKKFLCALLLVSAITGMSTSAFADSGPGWVQAYDSGPGW